MKKKIITTHIDTGGHGYLSVSKKDFLLAGADPKKITGCSGHNLTRIYLEEDIDQSYFWDVATANGFEVVRKSGYNLNFKITHNYHSELFDYVPTVGHIVVLSDDQKYQISEITPKGNIIVRHIGTGVKYRIGKTNPFEHIKGYATVLEVEKLMAQ
jgi:hypothetical protein